MNGWQKPFRGAQINPAHPLARGLAACWVMNEGGGKTIYDLSGNSNTGTFNTVPPVWGVGSKGFQLEYARTYDQRVNVTNSGSLSPTSGITLVSLVFPLAEAAQGLISKSDLASHFGPYTLDLQASNRVVQFVLNEAGGVCNSSSNSYTTMQWNHVVATYDQINMNVYVNSRLVGGPTAYTAAIASTNYPINIGAYYNQAFTLNGYTAMASVYNRALSASELSWLYAEPYAMFERPSPARFFFLAGGNVLVTVGKAALTATGKAPNTKTDIIAAIAKATATITGKAAKGNTVSAIAKAALTLAGKAVSTSTGSIVSIAKAAITATGKALNANLVVTVAKGRIILTGKRLGGLVLRGLSRLGFSMRID